jgi:putative flippase GtrA
LASLLTGRTERLAELWRYYKIGIINTLFGLIIFNILLFLHVNLFVAQIVSHVIGVIFNYFSFTRHVFRDVKPNRIAFFGSYVFNYFIGLAFLAAYHKFIKSPYIAGFSTMFSTAIFNYFILKAFVFKARVGARG